MKSTRLLTLPWLLCPLLAAATVTAADKNRDKHPGVVDGSALVEFANEDGTLVEITLHGPLLRQVGRSLAKSNTALGTLLKDMVAINAVVLEDSIEPERAKAEMKKLTRKLEDGDWERLGRVREQGSEIQIFVLNSADGETLAGLTVLVSETDELVFVNLAGRIDLEVVADLGLAMGLPGLDELGSPDWKKQIEGYEKSRHGNKKSGGDR